MISFQSGRRILASLLGYQSTLIVCFCFYFVLVKVCMQQFHILIGVVCFSKLMGSFYMGCIWHWTDGISLKYKRWFSLSTILFVLSIRDNWHQAWRYAFTSLKTSEQRACSPPLVAFTLVLKSLMASFRWNEPLWQVLHFPLLHHDHWISGKVSAACNCRSVIKTQQSLKKDYVWWDLVIGLLLTRRERGACSSSSLFSPSHHLRGHHGLSLVSTSADQVEALSAA